MFMASWRAREQCLASFDVIGKATCSQHHTFACPNGDTAFCCFDHGADDPVVFMDQFSGRR
ncbi:hypothetical protein D3C79_947950 [compost metagenome]